MVSSRPSIRKGREKLRPDATSKLRNSTTQTRADNLARVRAPSLERAGTRHPAAHVPVRNDRPTPPDDHSKPRGHSPGRASSANPEFLPTGFAQGPYFPSRRIESENEQAARAKRRSGFSSFERRSQRLAAS